MGVKCITLRENTERPITVEIGTNVLIGDDISKLNQIINDNQHMDIYIENKYFV